METGLLGCFDIFGQQNTGLLAYGEATTEVQKIAVKLTEGGFVVPLPEMQPGEFNVGPYAYSGTFYSIHPGRVILEFEQCASVKGALVVAFFAMPLDGIEVFTLPPGLPDELAPEMAGYIEKLHNRAEITLPSDNQYSTLRLSARRLFTCQTFHDLFRAEVFRESDGFGIKDVILLFTDLKSSTQLYQQIGDLNAFALVREHYGVLNTAILNQHGAIVKTIGDAIMATFNQPLEAVCAGLDMLEGLQRMNQASHHGDLILELLPQAGPMRLLERVEAHDEEHTVCVALPAASTLFQDDAGFVPSWIAIEYMAQCAAAHGGLLARARGIAPRLGLFVGSRRLVFRCERFAPDAVLRVSARHAAGHGASLAFDCAVEDPAGGPPLAEGRLNVRLLSELPGTSS